MGVILRNYSGEKIPVVGKITVPVKYENQEHILNLIVVEGNLPALFGRDWLSRIRVGWKNVFNVKVEVTKNEIQFLNLRPFQLNLMMYWKNTRCCSAPRALVSRVLRVSLKLKEDAKPVSMKDRPVPYSLVEKVEKEYDRLVESDILYPVSSSNWTRPVVHVP